MEKRFKSVDITRAYAIIFMITSHIYILWSVQYFYIAADIIYLFNGYAAPFFLIVSGISFFLYINNRIIKEYSKKEIFINVLKRALFLFIVTIIFLLAFGFMLGMQISFIIYWSIFQVIAFSMMVYFIIPFLKRYLRLLVMCSLFFFIFLAFFLISFYKIEILYILISGGNFTYLPWANFYIFGMLIGELLINTKIDKFKKILISFLSIGILNFILWFFCIRYINITVDYYFIPLFFVAYAGFFILFPLTYYYADFRESNSFIKEKLTRWGRVSFSLYYIHFVVIIGGFIIFPLLINDTYLRGFIFYQYLILLAIIFVGLDIFLIIWEKYDYIFGIEWFMTKITKKSTVSE